MSATFKNAKKKLSQAELRKLMNEHKTKNTGDVVKKIESPLAKYNEAGQLTCVLCKSVVRSEGVWNIHINAKQHRENVELAKRLKEQTKNFTTSTKRPLSPSSEVPVKKPKSILKNSTMKSVSDSHETETTSNGAGIPSDFFDSKKPSTAAPMTSSKRPQKSPIGKADVPEATEEPMETDSETLPEGFFDDPKLDARARNVDYKDPVEEEWEKFQREIKNANSESAAIIAEDQDEATNERQLDEIDEQMKNWSRVLTLEKKKTEIIAHHEDADITLEDSGSDPEDFNEFLDWRSKKSFR